MVSKKDVEEELVKIRVQALLGAGQWRSEILEAITEIPSFKASARVISGMSKGNLYGLGNI